MKYQPYLTTGAVAIVVGGAAFVGGMKYQEFQQLKPGNVQFQMGNGEMRGALRNGQGGPTGPGGQMRTFSMANRPTMGEIISLDETSMTVKLMDGSTKIVLLSDTTTVGKTTSGSRSDLTTGATVSVTGSTNSDGSVTAQEVQLNPVMPSMMPASQPTGSAVQN